MTWKDLTPRDARTALQRDPSLKVLDVRSLPEYGAHHIRGALLIPVQEIVERVGELEPSTPYLVTCEHGMRSFAACQFLAAQGFTALHNLEGGMAAWVDEGLPFEQG